MTAFAHFSIATVRVSNLYPTNLTSTTFVRPKWQNTRPRASVQSHIRMENTEKENPDLPAQKPGRQVEPEDDDHDDRLQKDPIYVYKEFAKVSAVAVLIGIVLFFYDILISLWVTTIGLVYALAVLFEIKGADTLFVNIRKSSIKFAVLFADGVLKGWNVLRTEVRKALKKWSHVRK